MHIDKSNECKLAYTFSKLTERVKVKIHVVVHNRPFLDDKIHYDVYAKDKFELNITFVKIFIYSTIIRSNLDGDNESAKIKSKRNFYKCNHISWNIKGRVTSDRWQFRRFSKSQFLLDDDRLRLIEAGFVCLFVCLFLESTLLALMMNTRCCWKRHSVF